MPDRVLPWLKPASWPGWSLCPCRPLLGHTSEDIPWLAYGTMNYDTFELVTLEKAGGRSQEDLEAEAVPHLLEVRPSWKVVQQRKKFLGLQAKPSVLAIEDDPRAAERILDPELLKTAETILECKLLAVGIPVRGLLMCASAEHHDEMPSFLRWVEKNYKKASGATPITDRVFLVRQGVIIGTAQPGRAPESRRAKEGARPFDLDVTFWQPDVSGTFRSIRNLGILGDEIAPPDRLSVDGVARDPDESWLEKAAQQCTRKVVAEWDSNGETNRRLRYYRNSAVRLQMKDMPLDTEAIVAMLAAVPFRVATFASLYGAPPKSYRELNETVVDDGGGDVGFRFGPDQHPLGFAVAFKGDGHKRVVSKRFLQHGPWKLIEEGDVSFVQFHAETADEETAKAQSAIGHARLALGAVPATLEMRHELKGFYVGSERQLRLTVEGDAALDPRRLLEARQAARIGHELEPGKPIESITFVFTNEAGARINLHELWLRELPCSLSQNGTEKRLDATYAPERTPPDWAV